MLLAKRLRELLGSGTLIVAPGAYDCISARLIKQAGFDVIYMTGTGTAASLGYPDLGLVGLTEMAENAGRIVDATDLPLIADADTGYGNELNAVRTVREFERRGAAAIHIEDQVFPKKCGHLDNKAVIPLEDYLSKIRAASQARRTVDFVLIARTDSRAALGFEEAVRRANAALDAGADVAFVEAPQTLDEVAAVPRLVKGPCLMNVVRGGKSPEVDFATLRELGYRIAIVPGMMLLQVLGACEQILEELKVTQRHPPTIGNLTVIESFQRHGFAFWDAIKR